jgi:spore maturation protein CgeB
MTSTSYLKILIIGKKNGILHWYEDILAASPSDTSSFAMNSFGLVGRLAKHWPGVGSRKLQHLTSLSLCDVINTKKPSLILIIDRFYLSPEVNAVIAKSGAKVAQWVGDKFDSRLALNSSVDEFFFTDTGLVKDAISMGLNCHYLPLATHLPDVKLMPWLQRTSKILFIGAPSESRITLLEQVKHPMLIIGPNWPNFHNPMAHVIRKRISIHETRAFYAKHRFVLNKINNNNLVCGLPARCFDATAYGSCLITDAVADLPLNFSEPEEAITYSSIDQLNTTISELINNSTLANKISLAGHNRTLKDHLFKHRLSNIINKLINH